MVYASYDPCPGDDCGIHHRGGAVRHTLTVAGDAAGEHSADLRVQLVSHRDARRSWVLLDATTGAVHARADRFLTRYEEGTQRTYAYHLVDHLRWLEKALLALGLLDQASELDLRSPQQDFFNPIWTQGWRAGDLVEMGGGGSLAGGAQRALEAPDQSDLSHTS